MGKRNDYRRVKVITFDSEEKKKGRKPVTRKLNFIIDDSLDDVIPFADIEDAAQFAKTIREDHCRSLLLA